MLRKNKECHDILLQVLLRQCREIKIHSRDIVMSSNLHYVATQISLLHHLSSNPSQIMSQQSGEMLQQSLLPTLAQLCLVATYHCLFLHSPVGYLELFLQHFDIMSRHSEIMT